MSSRTRPYVGLLGGEGFRDLPADGDINVDVEIGLSISIDIDINVDTNRGL